MASTAEGATLTAAHRQAQLALSRQTMTQATVLWQMLDVADLDAKSDQWMALQVRAILAGRGMSASMAAQYMRLYRTVEIGEALTEAKGFRMVGGLLLPESDVVARTALLQAIETSMRVTGPVRVKQSLGAGKSAEAAMNDGLSSMLGATQRQVLDGGREVTTGHAKYDPRAEGVARVASANACAFCMMLASRGAVYTRESAAFVTHDGCGCSYEVGYTGTDYDLPPGSANAVQEWDDYSKANAEADEKQSFRAWLDGQRKDSPQ